jgi:predicted dehydrogenase
MRVALIGCGAIAESFHLPALQKAREGGLAITLVDPDQDRAAALGGPSGIKDLASSHLEVADRTDAAIIATPHHTHVPIATELIRAGVPVLSEKPLGTTVAEVQGLIELAEARGVPVAINQTRRFIPACREIRSRITAGKLGDLRSVRIAEGDRFGWPAASPAMFGARSGGKGVLLDIGAHVFDLLVWWLGPEMVVESYRDDSYGGSEALAEARLRAGMATVDVRLSWLAKQPNLYRFEGTEGTLEWSVYDLDRIRIGGRGESSLAEVKLAGAPRTFQDLAPAVIEDFLVAVEQGTDPAVAPRDVLPSMRAIETCYENRERFSMPWQTFAEVSTDVG